MSHSYGRSELEILARTIERAGDSTIPAELRTRITHTLSHITSSLRSLRASSSQASLSAFLYECLPAVVRVFQVTFSALSHRSIARQALALLGLMYGVPDPKASDKHSPHQLVPPCLKQMALLHRIDDVRPLLNAMLLIASGGTPQRKRFAFFRQSVEDDDKYLIALSAMLSGWQTQGKQNEEIWTPVQFLDIAEAVSIASSLRIEQLSDRDRKLRFITKLTQIITNGMETVHKHESQRCILTNLAVSCGILKCLKRNGTHSSASDKTTLIKIVVNVVVEMEEKMQNFYLRFSQQTFNSDQSDTIGTVLLVSTVMSIVSKQLNSDCTQSLRRSIEKLMKLGIHNTFKSKHSNSSFHQQTKWCISSYSETLGNAYMALVNQERCYVSFLRFLIFFVPSSESNASGMRFIYTTALKCECQSPNAAYLLEIISLSAKPNNSLENLIARKFAPIIATDLYAITLLANTITFESDKRTVKKDRVNFLLRCFLMILRVRKALRKHGYTNEFYESRVIAYHDYKEIWSRLYIVLRSWLKSSEIDTDVRRYSLYCLGGIVELDHEVVVDVRSKAINSVVPILLHNYLFGKSGKSDQKRLLDSIYFLDCVTNSVVERYEFEEFVNSILQAAFDTNKEDSVAVGILMLRNAVKCNSGVVDIALGGITKLLNNNSQRKHQLLPLAQAAVLGTDMIRKNVCVKWILETFSTTDSISQRRTGIDFTDKGNKLISAKL